VVTFREGRELRLVDPRRFGAVRVRRFDELLHSLPISELGPEPLGRTFSGSTLKNALGSSGRGVRDALLDQTVVAGVGNIYAVESLFVAGIHPASVCRNLSETEWDQIAIALVAGLRHAIRRGGTTLKDFRDVTGSPGKNQQDLRVYGRAGSPCPTCGGILVAETLGQRTATFCPRCQTCR
jgi:formamidopyrimidine-DNA glycosylase